jgi:phage terminase large subunit-like protein
MTNQQIVDLDAYKKQWDWSNFARPEQLEPLEYLIWLIETGRGWGKTRTGAETTIKKVESGKVGRVALVAPTAADARDVMVDELMQNSGILYCSPPYFMPKYEKSNRRIVWPNGAVAHLYSAEEPRRLRGPQHEFAWCDEVAAWPHQTIDETWSNLMFGLRQGVSQVLITTTPRPIKFLRTLHKRHQLGNGRIKITKGSTFDNFANLSETYIEEVVNPYKGTRIGQQELYGQLLDDNPDAYWTYEDFELHRVESLPELVLRVGIAVDPTGSDEGHECGIIAGATGGSKDDPHGYVIKDYSMRGTPSQWSKKVIEAYDEQDADFVLVEKNFGGAMVETVVRLTARDLGHPPIPIIEVNATRGKLVRAEPVSNLYQQGRIHHVGVHEVLEDQSVGFSLESPNDRVDANVWLWTHMLSHRIPKLSRRDQTSAQAMEKHLKERIERRSGITTVVGSLWRRQF